MTALVALAERAGDLAVTGLVHGTVLAAITALACATILRRARPAIKSALWTLVLIKFVVPVGPSVPVSLSGAVDSLMAGPEASAPTLTAEVLVAPAPVVENAGPDGRALAGLALFLIYVLAIVWVARRRYRAHRRLRGNLLKMREIGAGAEEALWAAARRVGLARPPRAVRADTGAGPHLVGIFRPTLVIPGWLEDAGGGQLDAALVHELAHLRRRDTWLRGLQLAVGTLLFFFPVVAWVNRRLDVAREMACDDWVVARGAMPARAYAQLLVGMVRRSRGRAVCAAGGLAVDLLGRRHQLEERVEHLLRPARRRPAVGPMAGALLAAWGVISLAGSARASGTVPFVRGECVVDDSLIEQILASYPEADVDGDGALTRDEICAHQARMKLQLVEQAFEEVPQERLLALSQRVNPAADRDGDGTLDPAELDGVVRQLAMSIDPEALDLDPVAFPPRVCAESPAATCTEGDGVERMSVPLGQ